MKTILTLLFIMFLLGCSDIQKRFYKNKDAIINDSAIQRGWIPSIIPDSAYDIREKYNLDTNALQGSFKYNQKDEIIFLNELTKLNGSLIWKDFIFSIDIKKNKVEFKNNLKVDLFDKRSK